MSLELAFTSQPSLTLLSAMAPSLTPSSNPNFPYAILSLLLSLHLFFLHILVLCFLSFPFIDSLIVVVCSRTFTSLSWFTLLSLRPSVR